MIRHENRWQWPLSTALAVTLLLSGVFLTPRSWIAALFFPPAPQLQVTTAPEPLRWLELLPLSAVLLKPEIEPDAPPRQRPRQPPLLDDAEWWRRAWQIHVGRTGKAQLLGQDRDTTAVRPLELLTGDVRRIATQEPDSALAMRLALLRMTDDLDLTGLRARLDGITRGRIFTDLKSREADMFDEHLNLQIMTTDGPDEKELDAQPRRPR